MRVNSEWLEKPFDSDSLTPMAGKKLQKKSASVMMMKLFAMATMAITECSGNSRCLGKSLNKGGSTRNGCG